MENTLSTKSKDTISPLVAWAFSLGTAIGWGSFVVTTNTYLKNAGPAGSIFGLLIGAAVMLIISLNYHFLMNHFSGSGGIFTYASEALGADFGFIATWFMALTYISIFWANATSLPLFAKYLLGDFLRFGAHYSIFGYEVYVNEAVLSIAAMLLTGVLCINFRRFMGRLNLFCVLFFSIAIAVCFVAAMFRGGTSIDFEPSFAPSSSAFSQVLRIALISPWAFIGFEGISCATGDFGFSRKKSFAILRAAVLSATALYLFVILLSISAHPAAFKNWFDYIKNCGSLSGIDALPPFFAARHYLGNTGIALLFGALFALIITSFLGNVMVLTRLIAAVSKKGILPKKFGELNREGIPANATKLIIGISCFIPFLGRTAIGWIVDVTSINATIVYSFVSLAAWKLAKKEHRAKEEAAGFSGLVLMVIFAILLILPNLFTESAIATESYFLFIAWSILGFLAFHNVLLRDNEGRYGKSSIIVWIILSALILLMSLIWLAETNKEAIAHVLSEISDFTHGLATPEEYIQGEAEYMRRAMTDIHVSNMQSSVVVILLFAIQLIIMVSNAMIVSKHDAERAKATNIANTDPLTGVKSKHAFLEYENRINARLQSGEKIDFAVVVCDVNGLKQINDTLGHKAGDAYIQEACRLICTLFKHSPVFRIGGDEFVAVLSGTDFAERSEIMKKLNAQAESNRDNKSGVVVSAGISDFCKDEDLSILTVFERADALMYERKKELKGLR